MALEVVETRELALPAVGTHGREAPHVVDGAQVEDEGVERALRVQPEAVRTGVLQETTNIRFTKYFTLQLQVHTLEYYFEAVHA